MKETAFSGAFPLRDALVTAQQVMASDPLYDAAAAARAGLRAMAPAGPSRESSSRPTTPSTENGIVDGRGIVRDPRGVPLKRIGS